MKRIRLTPKAIADLAEIRSYTRATWGPVQADQYLQRLGEKLRQIADGTAAGRDAGIRGRDFRRSRHAAHLIFYTETSGHVRVIRIMHERQNFAAQLRKEK